jgi:hypothetical protein
VAVRSSPVAEVDFLASLARGGGRVLAIGTGRVALPLAARGIAVEGVEASAKMAAKLRAKPGGDRRPFGADSADHVSVYRLSGGCP